MLYSERNVRENIRNRDGKRVFFLGEGDTLTPSARDWLHRERIYILPARQAKIAQYVLPSGEQSAQKQEHMTHLRGNILVSKSAPIIAFRGAMDHLQSQILLAQTVVSADLRSKLEEISARAHDIIRWEVMEEPVQCESLCGLGASELRERSHFPQKYYVQPHFMPAYSDGATIAWLNAVRCAARNAELAAVRAFENDDGSCRRTDIVRLLNRMSSMLYILMIEQKAAREGGRYGTKRNTGADECGR